jgi:hypothetical protein
MEKAFDVKDLVAKLAAQGLPLAEEAAKLVVSSVLDWVQESVVVSENKYDDFAVPVIMAVKPFVMAQIDKIDGVITNPEEII